MCLGAAEIQECQAEWRSSFRAVLEASPGCKVGQGVTLVLHCHDLNNIVS